MARIDKFLDEHEKWKNSRPIQEFDFSILCAGWNIYFRPDTKDFVFTEVARTALDKDKSLFIPLNVAKVLYEKLKLLFEE